MECRTSVQQNAVYDHTNESDRIAQIADLHTSDARIVKDIRIITQEEYKQVTGKVASVTATGICTQELNC